ncbi:hypothetical protein GS453_18080 [Rhodococcus hoagii]|uniref:Uncharacterized protein n=1 Tax=Rhodococcus hoagii TaxID=43767 RepID=A0AAP2F4T3_RHOHA|nr:hypothetical protein [Prescottella equi]
MLIARSGRPHDGLLPSFQPHTTATRNVVTELARGGFTIAAGPAAAQLMLILREHDLPTEFYEAVAQRVQRGRMATS